VFIAISYSGAAKSWLDIVPLVKRRGAKADRRSPASRLGAGARRRRAPRRRRGAGSRARTISRRPASTTAALALGDALAVALLDARGFTRTISRARIRAARCRTGGGQPGAAARRE
jgi:arabinose-5-phosphate isomerase